MPARRQRAGLGLAVADDRRDDQVRVVERGPAGVRRHVPEFAALVDRARRFGGAVAADPAGEGELLEEPEHPLLVLAAVRVDLGVRPLQVARAEHARGAVPRSGHEDHVQVVGLDRPAQVDVAEGQTRAGAPVAEQPVLDVLRLERLLQERVRLQVGHAQGEVVARPPEGVDLPQFVRLERSAADGGPSLDRRQLIEVAAFPSPVGALGGVIVGVITSFLSGFVKFIQIGSVVSSPFGNQLKVAIVADQDDVGHPNKQPGADDAGNRTDVRFQSRRVRDRVGPAIENVVPVVG